MTEQWDVFELELNGPTEGNPFVDVSLTAQFSYQHRVVVVDGFYDGDGVYRVRFMPDTVGEWRYLTASNVAALNGVSGTFECVPPSEGNHGPVSVSNVYRFVYADGTPYFQLGTTCYVWNHQGENMEQLTLETLKTAPFNKMRMCVFPKHYVYNEHEPVTYPFEGEALTDWDFTRFDPTHFQHLEARVRDLLALGIQADLILFHPYDRWGFAQLPAEVDDRYLRYVVARLAAYRNVWWSMANEFDLMSAKTEADWDRFFCIVQQHDPYQRLRSVHNCARWYDHNKPWVTHASVQAYDVQHANRWREQYRKPIVVDECRYEGNIPSMWGNITGQDMTRLFWEGTVRGVYVGHGETYLHPENKLWWSHGGVLHGESPARIAFMKEVLTAARIWEYQPITSREIIEHWHDYACAARGEEAFVVYFGNSQPAEAPLQLPADKRYRATIIDTWEMTETRLDAPVAGDALIKLPGKPYIALLLQRLE